MIPAMRCWVRPAVGGVPRNPADGGQAGAGCQLQRLISLCGYAANWPLSAPLLRLVR